MNNSIIKQAISNKNKSLLDELFYSLETSSPDYLEIILSLLCESWHDFHYDILLELQRLKNPKAINIIFNSIVDKEKKSGEVSESVWFYKRAIWSLADIGTPESKKKLLLLSNSNNQYIKSYAQKRLDEWENELTRKSFKPLDEGWYLTDEENDAYTKELYIELAEGHPLFGTSLKVIAHDAGVYDEVFCKHQEEENYYSLIHLTWSQRKELEGYPTYQSGYSWEWFMEKD